MSPPPPPYSVAGQQLVGVRPHDAEAPLCEGQLLKCTGPKARLGVWWGDVLTTCPGVWWGDVVPTSPGVWWGDVVPGCVV